MENLKDCSKCGKFHCVCDYEILKTEPLNFEVEPCPECRQTNGVWRNFIGPVFYCEHCRLDFYSSREGSD